MTAAARLERALPGLFSAPAPPARVDQGLRRMERLAGLLDDALPIPGTSLRVGLDALLGVVPAVGDALAALLQGYIVLEAARLGVPRRVLGRMLVNVAVDTIVGSIPLLGGVFDIFFKANRRNVQLALDALAA